MFIQSRGPFVACLINDYVQSMLFVDNLGGPWSSRAWGSGPNGPVVDPPLRPRKTAQRLCQAVTYSPKINAIEDVTYESKSKAGLHEPTS